MGAVYVIPTSWTKTPAVRFRRKGFTLIELLTVMVIIMILTGLILAAARWAQEWAMTRRARGNMQDILTNLVEYKAQTGKFVNLHSQNFEHAFGFDGQYDKFRFTQVARYDPWGNAYQVEPYQGGVLIRSQGPDGIKDTDDDLYLMSN